MASSDLPPLDDTSERQAALRRYHVLDTAPEKKFDRITGMAAKVCDVPAALITLIDEERQWFKSCFGFDQRQTDLDVSFCVYAVDAGNTLVVEDATNDPRFQDNPLVTGPPHIRFYAGAPLTTPNGIHIGTLCIIDYETRTFDAAQREILENLADMVVEQSELRSAERQIRQLVGENPQPMYVVTQTGGRLLDANLAASELYGYEPAVLSSMTTDALLAPPSVQPSRETLSIHEDADGAPLPVRVRTEDILYDGHQATLVVPQPLTDDTDTTVFFRADRDGTVQSLGPAWTEVTGRPPGETVGTPLSDLVVAADRAALDSALSALHEEQADVRHHVASFRTANGRRDLALRAQLVQAAEDASIGIVGTLSPVSGEVPRSDNAANETADAPATLPSAPDPPTPSASVSTEDASGTDDVDDDSEACNVFSPSLPDFQNPDEAAAAETAANGVDAGGSAPAQGPAPPDDAATDPMPEAFSLTAHLHALVDDHTDAPAHDQLYIQRSLPDSSCPVRLDPSIVDSLIGTLLDNALTHTEKGSVTIGMTVDDEEEVHIEVVDTGTGVEERFMQVYMDAANPSASPDNLQRVHRLAERIGGSLNMEDATAGTRFQLTLPRSSAGTPSDAASPEPE